MKEEKYTIAVIVGSLRKESLSLKMARFVQSLPCDRIALQLVSIGDLTIYNEDLETDCPPLSWQHFRQDILEKDAILFITPEYNRSIPAVLKNAIDIGSSPHGQNVFANKPAAIISLSPGKMGAFGANHHLRQCLVFLNMPTMQQPEAYIGDSEDLFDSEGSIQIERTRDYIARFIDAFSDWIAIHR